MSTKCQKNEKKMTINVTQHGYDIYDRFTMEHFLLCQSMILTTSIFCSRQYSFIDNHRKYSKCSPPAWIQLLTRRFIF
jgi:hypothetical protein